MPAIDPVLLAILRRLLLAMSLLSAPSLAHSADYGCQQPLEVGVMYMGVLYFDDHGIKRGFDLDLMDEVSRRTGCLFETKELSRVLQLRLLKSGQLAVGTAIAISADRARELHFFPLLAGRNEVLLAHPELDHIKSPDDLIAQPGSVLGIVGGAVYGEPYDALVKTLLAQKRVVVSPDHASNMRQLEKRRIQAVIVHPFMYLPLISQVDRQARYSVRQWAKRNEALRGGWALSPARFTPAQIAQWQALFASLRADGTLLRLLSRYMDAEKAKDLMVR